MHARTLTYVHCFQARHYNEQLDIGNSMQVTTQCYYGRNTVLTWPVAYQVLHDLQRTVSMVTIYTALTHTTNPADPIGWKPPALHTLSTTGQGCQRNDGSASPSLLPASPASRQSDFTRLLHSEHACGSTQKKMKLAMKQWLLTTKILRFRNPRLACTAQLDNSAFRQCQGSFADQLFRQRHMLGKHMRAHVGESAFTWSSYSIFTALARGCKNIEWRSRCSIPEHNDARICP